MVWMEVRKEDAVYGERIQARPEHAADRARTEVEDERLPTRAYHDAALAPLEAWNDGAGTYDGDLHGFLPPVGSYQPADGSNTHASPAIPSRAPPMTSEA